MKHHELSKQEAYDLARDGLKRYEENKPKIHVGKGNPSDYSKACLPSLATSVNCPDANKICSVSANCSEFTETCSCPDPLPNSHYVSDDCSRVILETCVECKITPFPPLKRCETTGLYRCNGNCYYDCDPPYEWNPVTQQCELVAVPKAGLHPSKVVPLIIDE